MNRKPLNVPFRQRFIMADQLTKLHDALGMRWDFTEIQRCVNRSLRNGYTSFRLGGACFDIGIGFQKAAIRVDLGPLGGCSITAD